MHGVLNALVFTTFFICGFLPFMTSRALGRPLARPRLGWLTFWLMTAGLVLASIPLVGNAATVMFTFYPPLKAHWAFYIGLTLVVVGTWLVTLNLALTWRAWRADHPGARTPLAAFMSLVTFAMWTIASVGLAAEMLVLTIPWSLGIVAGTDALLARTLFWFTGHAIVYFWLLPAYVSWYTLVPRQAGGKLLSDPMARTSFILFLLLSTPIGIHHQYADPGIHQGWKLLHALLTFAVFFPSLLTFFNVVASLEIAGRARGGTGWLSWFLRLPWGDPSVAAQVLAMVLFAFGGVGGLILASFNVNIVVHNTAYIPGHLHLTVGSAVMLTFVGITYWLVPHLAGRAAVEPVVGPHPGLAVARRGPALFSDVARARTARHAAPDHDGSRRLHAVGLEDTAAAGRDRGQPDVPEHAGLLPQHGVDRDRVTTRRAARAAVRGSALRAGSRPFGLRPLAAVARDGGIAGRAGVRADLAEARLHHPAQYAGHAGLVTVAHRPGRFEEAKR